MRSIGKGARFLVLSGERRGQHGAVVVGPTPSTGMWLLDFDGISADLWATPADLEGPGFKRLDDVPAEVDPLFAEVAALEATRSAHRGGPENDDRRPPEDWSDLISSEVHVDGITDEERRECWMEIVVLALAGIRAIDRR